MNLDQELIENSFVKSSRVYLNNASSSLIPLSTIKAMTDFTVRYNELGPDSLDFTSLLSIKSNELRQTISKLVNCRQEEVILTSSVTEGINNVANGMSFAKDSNVVIRGTTHEHHANYYPWLRLAKKVELRSVPHDSNGFFEISEMEKRLDRNTKLVSLSHGLYNTGAILPIPEIGKILNEKEIPFFLDAAQTVGCTEFDFAKTGADYVAFNGYKWLCGPMGVGIFICKREAAPMLEPMNLAGESAMIYDDSKLAYKDIPDKFQGGFRNFAAIIGLQNSISFLSGLGIANIREKIIGLANLLREELVKIPDVTLYGPEDQYRRTSIVSFTIGTKSPQEIVQQLERRGFVLAVREISDKKLVRASPHFFNTESDMLKLVDLLKRL
ncbi:MAG: aminotransferase class V-fold PLP-dependent enzyme [Thaumarchaeota archaeon]|nr:aminotransferase class V-fold PLP-dependent enzyme [Nitrososphaerota archaeon]